MVLKYNFKLKSVYLNVLVVCFGMVRKNNRIEVKGLIHFFIQKGEGVEVLRCCVFCVFGKV